MSVDILTNHEFSYFGHSPAHHDSDTGYSNDVRLESFLALNAHQERHMVCLVPTRGTIDPRVVESWFKLSGPVNQTFARLFIDGHLLAESYNAVILAILHHPFFGRQKYILTLEENFIPPADGLLKLVESMILAEKKGEDLWAISGLRKSGKMPALGKPELKDWNLEPITLNRCGYTKCLVIPQGFTLYRTDLFRKFLFPWFGPRTTEAPLDIQFFKKCFDAGLSVGIRSDVQVDHAEDLSGQV